MAARQVQAYLDRHRIGALFEVTTCPSNIRLFRSTNEKLLQFLHSKFFGPVQVVRIVSLCFRKNWFEKNFFEMQPEVTKY